ncbi:hypothetical protein [Nocardia sp. NBC_01327]|uniref:hypothetical protein n=1 Tax=Nocardia sp. NBC_01327 TaxID=2903593 RepID=UPI002E1616FA|nr:hypothetical protein OG326_21540 [Nocardia sp. NBC_01327]
MLPQRKPCPPAQQKALGYMNRERIPAGVDPESIGMVIRIWAEEQGYLWGGTYLATSDDEQTIAALTRAAGGPDVDVIVVPSSRHLPASQHMVVSGDRRIRVVVVR